jgi:16S rRNA (guanine966-N2)-methyltransferase
VAKTTSVARAAAPNRVRIIAGEYRSRILRFPASVQLRPTPDRVRETIFNWLGQDLTGCTCLDLFAGSGALGFEAASRNAAAVVMVEQDHGIFAALQENQRLLGATRTQLVQRNALEFIGKEARRYDIIFIDPPYDFAKTEELFSRLPALLAPGGMVYREGPRFLTQSQEWVSRRQAKAGAVHYQLLQYNHA